MATIIASVQRLWYYRGSTDKKNLEHGYFQTLLFRNTLYITNGIYYNNYESQTDRQYDWKL
jgi:hypothetical protein